MPSVNFPGHSETFLPIQKPLAISKLSGTFQTIWKLFRPAGNFPVHPETFQSIWKLYRPPGDNPLFGNLPDTYILCRKRIYAHLLQIVAKKIYTLFIWKVFVGKNLVPGKLFSFPPLRQACSSQHQIVICVCFG